MLVRVWMTSQIPCSAQKFSAGQSSSTWQVLVAVAGVGRRRRAAGVGVGVGVAVCVGCGRRRLGDTADRRRRALAPLRDRSPRDPSQPTIGPKRIEGDPPGRRGTAGGGACDQNRRQGGG